MNMEKMNQILLQVKKVIIGKDEILKNLLLSIMARGHILIEDIPGVGKTTLAKAISKAMDLQCKRLQFTPDVLPSDITGFSIFDKNVNDFVYKYRSKKETLCNNCAQGHTLIIKFINN